MLLYFNIKLCFDWVLCFFTLSPAALSHAYIHVAATILELLFGLKDNSYNIIDTEASCMTEMKLHVLRSYILSTCHAHEMINLIV